MNFRKILLSGFCVFAAISIMAQVFGNFTPQKALSHIEFLASDDLKGRKPGTPENLKAATYIRDQFRKSGLTIMGNDGFQEFELITGISLGENNRLILDGLNIETGVGFTPMPFSKNGEVSSTAVFVGYGFVINNDSVSWDDFSGVDVKDKWVVILRGAPKSENGTLKLSGNIDERFKVMLAQDNGAAGVIFVSGSKLDSDDNLLKLSFDKSPATSGIPVVQIKRAVLDEQLKKFDKSVSAWENEIAAGQQPVNAYLPLTIEVSVNLNKDYSTARNVVGMIEGADPVLKDQFVIIGAHYDHLGLGGYGSGSRVPDTTAVHYGADDNASGVAGVLELARHFSDPKNKPARSILFIAFDAEEMGLIGSRYFVNNPMIDLKKVTAMINLDMIGRLKDTKSISVGGTGTSLETAGILNQLAEKYPLTLSYSSEGFGPSDHAAFYGQNIPVFFISTGAHSDYHTPADNVSGINAEGMVAVLDFSAGLLDVLASRSEMLTFQEAGPATRGDHRYNFKVTLGIMPDNTSSGNDGLRVEGVRPGGPAAAGGMLKGDVITAIDGSPVGNIYDYMGRLKNLEAGQVISVDVKRNNLTEVLIIQL